MQGDKEALLIRWIRLRTRWNFCGDAAGIENQSRTNGSCRDRSGGVPGEKGMPFRKAHALVGKLVAECAARGTALNQLPFEQLKKRSRSFDAERSSFPFAAAGDRCALAEKYRDADQGVAREV